MSRGFVTIAVGDISYYRMAHNLLTSYRRHTKSPLPFAILADKNNKYTDDFDVVKIIQNPYKSYLDKLSLLQAPIFDENIFIDADCLAYRDLNDLFGLMPTIGVSCIGRSLPLSNKTDGWFAVEGINDYAARINYIPQMHGGMIFFRKDLLTKTIFEECMNIADNYSLFKFKYFTKPADEPILALAIASNGGRLIEVGDLSEQKYIAFYPSLRKVVASIVNGNLSYMNMSGKWVEEVYICHWQNSNIYKSQYKNQILWLKSKENLAYRLIKCGLNILSDAYKESVYRIKVLVCKIR